MENHKVGLIKLWNLGEARCDVIVRSFCKVCSRACSTVPLKNPASRGVLCILFACLPLSPDTFFIDTTQPPS